MKPACAGYAESAQADFVMSAAASAARLSWCEQGQAVYSPLDFSYHAAWRGSAPAPITVIVVFL
jgi:hypothetical protein